MKNLMQIVMLASVVVGCGARGVTSKEKGRTTSSNGGSNGFLNSVESLSVGGNHTCALINNEVKCWGYNDYGQASVPSLFNPRQVSSGYRHTCALDDFGLNCWGDNEKGQTSVPSLANPRQVSAGFYQTCAIDDSGVKCWGDNQYGQTNVPPLSNPRYVSSGERHTCANDDTGVKCWGDNRYGQTNVPWLSNPRHVSSGSRLTCAIDDIRDNNAPVKCWGNIQPGRTDIQQVTNHRHVSSGGGYACAIDGTRVKCWSNREVEMNVPLLSNARHVSSGSAHTCAIDDTGIMCWGNNRYGQTNAPSLSGGMDSFFPWPAGISFRSFQDRKVYFDKLTRIYEDISTASQASQEQQLLFFLQEGLVAMSTAAFFVEKVAPQYKLAKDSLYNMFQISSAADIPQTAATLKISLEVLEAGLSASKPLLASATQREVESLIFEINSVLAAGADVLAAQRVIQHLQSNPQLLSEYKSVERLASYSALIGDVTKWIGP